VHLYTVDSATGQSSGTTFLAEGDQQQKVGQWLQFEQQDLTLLPGESRAVKFTVTVPAGVAPGQHLGGLAAQDTAVRKGPSAGAIQVSVQSRVVTAVQINVAGPTIEQVSVTGVTTKGAEGYQQLLLGLRNDGNSLVKPTGTLLVVDADGREIQRLALKLDTFVPETEIQYPVFVERQILGRVLSCGKVGAVGCGSGEGVGDDHAVRVAG
jgi:hypothetical protein